MNQQSSGYKRNLITNDQKELDWYAEVTVLDKPYFIFEGWNTREDGKGTLYTADDIFSITSDTDLYAQWKKASKISGGPNVDSDKEETNTLLPDKQDMEKTPETGDTIRYALLVCVGSMLTFTGCMIFRRKRKHLQS